MKYRNLLLLALLILCISTSVFAQVGPYLDTIYMDVRMQEDIGIQDTAAGKTDLFLYGLNGPQVVGLDRNTLSKLEMYSVPSGSWSLLLNPIPNEAPYIWKVNGVDNFNPFAIEDVRFALNFLINRQYICDEILAGTGGVMYNMATPGQPGTYKYNLIASKFGFSPEGDEQKALDMIEKAMNGAAELDALRGRLKKDGQWWTFDGEPVTIKFLIRVDDPNGRLKEGQYIANQIEKAGIKVDRLLWDRNKCSNTVYSGDPANYEWSMYTEGWGAGATRAYWDNIVCQMYANFYGYIPGGGDPNNWNFIDQELDDLALKAYLGNILTVDEYWDAALKATELGLKDAVRIYVCYQMQYFLANKDSFAGRFAYGLGDGLNNWSLVTAKTKSGTLRATQFSAMGSLFMSAWDPVGTDGFSDTYSIFLAGPLTDVSMFESPSTALPTACLATPTKVDSQVHADDEGNVVGDIAVPSTAVTWDSANDKWVPVTGKKSMSVGTYEFKLGNMHHGMPMSLLDFMYQDAFVSEWCTKDGDDDKYYDESFSSLWKPIKDTSIGTIYDFDDNTITNYFDYNFPADKNRVAFMGVPEWRTVAGQPCGVTWEVIEALSRMVAQGSASGTIYTFASSEEGATEVDVLRPSCVDDIKAELQRMIDEKWVPASLEGYLKPEDAVKRYQAALDFVKKYGHAYISNGPFYMSKFDTSANYAELKAFRDPTYPFNSDYWMNQFKTTVLTVENVDLPSVNTKGSDVKVKIQVSQSTYPEITKTPANDGNVTLLLITDAEELTFQAKMTGAGVFEATIPASAVDTLASGSYTLLAMAELPGVAPATANTNFVVD